MDKINGKREEERKETASSNTSLPSSSMINGSALFKLQHTHLWTSTKHFQNSERNSSHLFKGNSKREQRENTILFSRTPFDPKRENKERTKREHHITLDSRAQCKERAKREQRENKERTPYYSLAPRLTLKERTKREQRENKERTAIVNWILGRNAKREQRENKERTKRESHTILYLFSHPPFDLLQCYNT